MEIVLNRLRRIVNKMAQMGVLGTLCCVLSRLYLNVLMRKFSFDPWHASAPFCCRPYKQKVVRELHSLGSNGVVEIGCGLGEIGQKLQKFGSLPYLGIDCEEQVILAARYLSRKDRFLDFEIGSFERLKDLASGKFDVLLLLNWPHLIEARELVELISKNIGDNIRFLLMDCIRPETGHGFKNHHSPPQLIEYGLPFQDFKTLPHLDEVRDLVVFSR